MKLRFFPYELPYEAPLRTSRGIFSSRCGWLIALRDDDGRCGWGDVAPWPGFGAGEAVVVSEICAIQETGLVDFEHPFESAAAIAVWVESQGLSPELSYGLELALLDLLGQRLGCCIAKLLSSDAELDLRSHALATGDFPTDTALVKIKVGGASIEEDLKRIRDLRDTCGTEPKFRLDVGGAWTQLDALGSLETLAQLGVVLIEEPYVDELRHTLPNLRYKAEEAGIAIAADESIRTFDDLEELIDDNAIDVAVLKPMFVGGLYRSLQWARFAQEAGVEVVITHALESSIGRRGAMHLAACIENSHGLDSSMKNDLAPVLDFVKGDARLPDSPGLGIEPKSSWILAQADLWKEPSIPNPLWSSRVARPDHFAIAVDNELLSYRDLAHLVQVKAVQLREFGILPGMVVGLDLPSGLDWVVHFHALGWLGAAVAPLEQGLPHDARVKLIELLGAQFVLTGATELPSPTQLDTDQAVQERFWPMNETRLVVCTSGTSGTPTPIRLSTRQLIFSAFSSAMRLGLRPEDRWLCCLPLSHVGGISIIMRSLIYGTTVELHDAFDAQRVVDALESGRVSLVSLVPTMLERVLERKSAANFPDTLRAVLVGGAPMSSALQGRCAEEGIPVSPTWGMTESASQVATGWPGSAQKNDSTFIPLNLARVDAVEGKLRVRGPLVEGEFLTADLGSVDADGRVQIEGRADDIIISGGKKIAPSEIEAVLTEHSGVASAAVVSIPSTQWGERPVAVLESNATETPSVDELVAWCGDRLARYKVPDQFIWCDALPRTALKKVSRGLVRDAVCRTRNLEDFEAFMTRDKTEKLLFLSSGTGR